MARTVDGRLAYADLPRVLAAAVFLCSFAVSWLLSKIPLLGRYLT